MAKQQFTTLLFGQSTEEARRRDNPQDHIRQNRRAPMLAGRSRRRSARAVEDARCYSPSIARFDSVAQSRCLNLLFPFWAMFSYNLKRLAAPDRSSGLSYFFSSCFLGYPSQSLQEVVAGQTMMSIWELDFKRLWMARSPSSVLLSFFGGRVPLLK